MDIAEDLIPYLARNQYKDALMKYYEEANRDRAQSKQEKELAARVEMMLNPNKVAKKETIKVLAYIDPAGSQSNFVRFKSDNISMYHKANIEGSIMLQQQKAKSGEFRGPLGGPHLFSATPNNIPDLLSISEERPQNITDSNIALPDGEEAKDAIAADSNISRSVIGQNVKIGSKTKIVNSVIQNNCTIGANCVITNSLILRSTTVPDKAKLTGENLN